MRAGSRALRRTLCAALVLVLAVGVAAPFVNASRFAGRIRGALEQGLSRRVEIGKVKFNLFTGPGFTVENVVIHEDPAVGIEPLAYVGELNARVGLWGLVTGRLEFSTLRLIEPSINLSKPDSGSWNLQSLVARAASARSPGAEPPVIEVRGGRFNFKFGDVKSVFYLSNADVDVTPAAGAAEFRFSGEPARTDRGAQGFGRLTGRGRWRPSAEAGQEFELDLNLERSAIAEIVRLFHGHDVGLHGMVTSRARLTGPLSDIRIAGRLQIEDVHRWDLMPQRGQEWPLDYRGRIDVAAQVVELETLAPQGQPSPVSVRVRALDFLTQPRWASVISVRELPVANLLEVARHFGAAVPSQLSTEGTIEGAIGYSRAAGLEGQFLVRNVAVSTPEAGTLRIERARVAVERDWIRALPFTVETAFGRAVQLEAEFRSLEKALDVHVSSRGMPVAELRAVSERMFGVPGVPFLGAIEAGTWRGSLRYRRAGESAPQWAGAIELRDLQLAVDGLAEPLAVQSANFQVDGGRLVLSRIRARAGQLPFEGDFRFAAGTARPHRFRFSALEADAAELERVFAPALRRQRGLLARTLRLVRGGTPDWLQALRAEGSVEIGALTAGDIRWENVRARLQWNGATVEVPELLASWSAGQLKAKGTISLVSPQPVYRFEGGLKGFGWRGATIDVNGLVETAGSGEELFENLKSSGTLASVDVPLMEEVECLFAKGRYEVSFRRGVPRVKLTSLEMNLGDELFQGQAASLADGRVAIDLSDGRKGLRLLGRLTPFRFETAQLSAQEKK